MHDVRRRYRASRDQEDAVNDLVAGPGLPSDPAPDSSGRHAEARREGIGGDLLLSHPDIEGHEEHTASGAGCQSSSIVENCVDGYGAAMQHKGPSGTPEKVRRMQEHLRAWRKRKGLSLDHIGNMLGLRATTIGRWEKKQVALTTADLGRLADLYSITVGQLIQHPDEADLVHTLERVQKALSGMSPDDIERWIALGESLSDRRG